MNKRDTLLALFALGAAPFAVHAQQAQKVYRIGVLSLLIPLARNSPMSAPLRELGYEEGRNLEVDYKFAEGKEDRLAGLARDLVAGKPDLIIAISNPEILAAKRATTTIPIIMVYALAPVESGLIASLARPGGNITGMSVEEVEISGKKLELLRDAVPRIARVVILWNPERPGMEAYRPAAERAAKAMGIRLTELSARNLEEIEHAFTVIAQDRPDALMVASWGAFFTHRARIIEFAARQRLPAMYSGGRYYAAEGGLMSYSFDSRGFPQRIAAMADHILKGAKPADIPVEQPTQFEIVINLKTAKALGLAIPQSVLLRATEVIE